jgi:hypothetical protein
MPRVFQDGQFVAVETVAPGSEHVNQERPRSDAQEKAQIFSITQVRIRSSICVGGSHGSENCVRFDLRRHGNLKKQRHDSRRSMFATPRQEFGEDKNRNATGNSSRGKESGC